MTDNSLGYVLFSCLFAFSLGTAENYRFPWSERFGGRPNEGLPKANGENYPQQQQESLGAEYTDFERSNLLQGRIEDPTWESPVSSAPPRLSFQSPYSVVTGWPLSDKKLGQVTAVSFDQEGNVVVFHRGDHVWNALAFLENNIYNQKGLGPIEDNTIVTFDATTGKLLHEWGANIFYMPHGLTVDKDSNVWVTDVALHQVFKYPPHGNPSKPLLELGVRFEPGTDDMHFCKPSAVAVTNAGDFFVSDGYCNHRVIKFNSAGKKLLVWGRSMPLYNMPPRAPPPNAFAIPHALTLAEDKGMVCVADRENGRIQCFSITNGTFVLQIKLKEFGSKLFSAAYTSVQGGLIFAVNGEDILSRNDTSAVHGFVIGLTSQQLVAEFFPSLQGFKTPHDVAVSTDGKQICVVQLNPPKVWKFVESPLVEFPESRLKILQSPVLSTLQSSSSPTTVVPLSLLSKDALQSSSHNLLPSIEPAPHVLSLTIQVFIALAAIVALTVVAILFVFVRRGPWFSCWMCYKRWQFRREPSDGFKLGSLLDPHSGFEQVCTEMSDEEEIDMAASTSNVAKRTSQPLIPRA